MAKYGVPISEWAWFIKDCWGVYEQNSRVNSVHVDGWIAELAIIASNATERILYTLVTTFIKKLPPGFLQPI